MDDVAEPAEAIGTGVRAFAAVVLLIAAGLSAPALALETRSVPIGEFHRVHISGAGTVHLTQGDSAHLAVRGEAETIRTLKIQTHEGVLYIETSGFAPELVVDLRVVSLTELVSEGEARITGDDLNFDVLRLEGNGAGSFHLHRLEARELEVHSRGATRFDLTGQVGRQRVQLSGTGAYQAGELISNRIDVSVAGASDVRLWADEHLDVEVAGSADIRYAGSPPRVEQRISGAASVLRIPQIVI